MQAVILEVGLRTKSPLNSSLHRANFPQVPHVSIRYFSVSRKISCSQLQTSTCNKQRSRVTTTKRYFHKNCIVFGKQHSSHSNTGASSSTSSNTDNSKSHSVDEVNTPRITVIGIGGAGGNAIDNMIAHSLVGADFIGANTDAQALQRCKAATKIQLGRKLAKGLGAGSKPLIGKEAAEESLEEVMNAIGKTNMLFVTAGMGGGTGTGGAPVIADAAKERGILTVGIVTTPFLFEGIPRMEAANEGIAQLEKVVDTLIVIPNQKLLQMNQESKRILKQQEAFQLVDNVLLNGVRSIIDIVVNPGEVNCDFADVTTIMSGMGRGLLGRGEAEGRGRAKFAIQSALNNPLLDNISIKGAKGVLLNICSGDDLTMDEINDMVGFVRESVHPNALIKWGLYVNEEFEGKVRVDVIITGVEDPAKLQAQKHKQKLEAARNLEEDDEEEVSTRKEKKRTKSEDGGENKIETLKRWFKNWW